MTKHEQNALLIVGGVGAVIIVLLMLYRRSDAAPGSDSLTPGSYAPGAPYNAPPSRAGSSCCGCSSQSATIYNSLNAMLDAFQKGSADNMDRYEKAVYSSYPASVVQYFNNSSGAQAFAQSQATFKY